MKIIILLTPRYEVVSSNATLLSTFLTWGLLLDIVLPFVLMSREYCKAFKAVVFYEPKLEYFQPLVFVDQSGGMNKLH